MGMRCLCSCESLLGTRITADKKASKGPLCEAPGGMEMQCRGYSLPVNRTTQNVTNEKMADQIPTMPNRNKCGTPMWMTPKRVRRINWPRECLS